MTEKDIVVVFDGCNGNPYLNTLKFISENHEGDERTYIGKIGDDIVNSLRLLLVSHNSSDFDSWVVLNSLVKDITELKIVKTARGFISLSFQCGVKIGITCEVPQYVKVACSKFHIKRSLEKTGRDYEHQLELLKGDIKHSVIN